MAGWTACFCGYQLHRHDFKIIDAAVLRLISVNWRSAIVSELSDLLCAWTVSTSTHSEIAAEVRNGSRAKLNSHGKDPLLWLEDSTYTAQTNTTKLFCVTFVLHTCGLVLP